MAFTNKACLQKACISLFTSVKSYDCHMVPELHAGSTYTHRIPFWHDGQPYEIHFYVRVAPSFNKANLYYEKIPVEFNIELYRNGLVLPAGGEYLDLTKNQINILIAAYIAAIKMKSTNVTHIDQVAIWLAEDAFVTVPRSVAGSKPSDHAWNFWFASEGSIQTHALQKVLTYRTAQDDDIPIVSRNANNHLEWSTIPDSLIEGLLFGDVATSKKKRYNSLEPGFKMPKGVKRKLLL